MASWVPMILKLPFRLAVKAVKPTILERKDRIEWNNRFRLYYNMEGD